MTDAEPHPDDQQLLRDYVERRSGSAFAELVRRHVDAVYSSAVRRVNGDRALAEDIVQCVFTDLARKAAQLPPGTVPGGWLHRHTGFVASHHIDRERRRRAREQQAVAMNALTDAPGDAAWHRTAPLLDAALDALPDGDRDAIVLRFFEKRDFRAVGQALGVSDDTAQKRVTRALDKLRGLLTRRGVTSTGAALSAIMLANTVTQAPAALVSALPGRALAGAATSGGSLASALATLSLAARWRLAALAAGLAIAGAAPFLIQRAAQPAGSPAVTIATPVAPVPPPPATPPPAPPAAPIPEPPQSVEDIVTAAAAVLRGGAQNVSATARGLALLTQIPAAQAEDALARIAKVPDTAARGLLYRYFLSHWAETDGRKALDFATRKIPDENRIAVTEGILAAWAAKDPEAVLGWNMKERGTAFAPMSESLLATIYKTLASKSLTTAFERLSWMSRANDRAHALRGILETVQSPADRQRIIDVAAGMKDDVRIQTHRAVIESWAHSDPASAAAWVETMEPAWERPRLMDSLGLAWLQKDPQAAAAWWVARAPGPETLVKIINVWSQSDPGQAAQWLSAQPAGPAGDTARATFARQVSDLDLNPESALSWAASVGDETMRRSTVEHILNTWRARDPAAAARYEAKTP